MKLRVGQIGRVEYQHVLILQEKLLDLRLQGKIDDTLILVEHPPVITIGKNGKDSNILANRERLRMDGVNIYEVSRGGDVTYHGPGQIVGYPIMDLNYFGKDIHDFVWKTEEVFIRLLKDIYQITAYSEPKKYTGVWVNDEKIVAIGIQVKKWITMHGFAFNVNTQLEHFRWIVPCGIPDKGVTSLQKITGSPQDLNMLNQLIIKYFSHVFQMQVVNYVHPAIFKKYSETGMVMGFKHVNSGPLVRSSYHAEQVFQES